MLFPGVVASERVVVKSQARETFDRFGICPDPILVEIGGRTPGRAELNTVHGVRVF